MPQAYGSAFARVYNQLWAGHANRVAPQLIEFYEATPIGRENRKLLDLCCGTGQLSLHFLERGFRVMGLDLSEGMLQYARQNAMPYVIAQQAEFVLGDAAHFLLDESFGLIVSTYDALNHLPDPAALQGCLRSAWRALDPGGYFIFDLNTAQGLRRNWNGTQVSAGEEIFLFQRGLYDEATVKAWNKITGFLRGEDGRYERFDETVYNTVFAISDVLAWLAAAGFASVYPARLAELGQPIADPEAETNVVLVAQKEA